jgi:hypothetical protein
MGNRRYGFIPPALVALSRVQDSVTMPVQLSGGAHVFLRELHLQLIHLLTYIALSW